MVMIQNTARFWAIYRAKGLRWGRTGKVWNHGWEGTEPPSLQTYSDALSVQAVMEGRKAGDSSVHCL